MADLSGLGEDPTRAQREPMLESSSASDRTSEQPPSNPSKPQVHNAARKPSALARLTSWPWIFEVLALFLGLAAIASMLGTLLPYQGRPLPQLPISISINALLSVYSAVLKACLAYVIYSCMGQLQWTWFARPRPLRDLVRLRDAGSGGWGSLLWLWSSRNRSSFHPALCLGALVAILTVAVDPFVQQLVSPSDCEAVVRGDAASATMRRTSFFPQASLTEVDFEDSLLPAVQDAILAGVFTSKLEPLRGVCASGNCTFPVFSTAAYCSACDDVSDELKFSYKCRDNGDDEDNDDESIDSFCRGDADFRNGTIQSYLPEADDRGFQSNLWDIVGPDSDDNEMNFLTGTWYRDEQLYEHSAYTVIAGQTSFYVDGVSPATGQPPQNCTDVPKDDWRCRGYGAAVCSLYPCVHTYKAKVANGLVEEELLETTTKKDIGDTPYWMVHPTTKEDLSGLFMLADTECASPSDRQGLADHGLDVSRRWVAWNLTYDDFDPESLFADGCGFMWSRAMDSSLHAFFNASGLLSGTVNGNWFFRPAAMTVWSPQFAGPQELQRLYNRSAITFDSVQSMFDNIATSLTQYIRVNGHEDYSRPAAGTELHYAICLSLAWGWIAMPASLWVGVTMLLCVTVLSASRTSTPVWKFSPLPLVLQGPFTRDEKEDRRTNNSEDRSGPGLEERAQAVTVQLSKIDDEIGLWRAAGR